MALAKTSNGRDASREEDIFVDDVGQKINSPDFWPKLHATSLANRTSRHRYRSAGQVVRLWSDLVCV